MDNYRPGDIKYKDVNGDVRLIKMTSYLSTTLLYRLYNTVLHLIGTTRHSVLVFCLKESLKYNIFKVVGDSILS